ncbi:uncharacterized protein LOC115056087 [Echeneis naucrates]|uniref:uncharacterized protein LOC115056087 n=1 Tax=Echeneis naucrates TaxID=173247 RepID=UPI001113D62B|nr:uncharacterized protein LOC115056087 [Echeneis naucrates]
MAEEGSAFELGGLEAQLQSLLSRYSGDELRDDGEAFCSDFCELVEQYASRRQVPLPQLRILEIALCYFARASSSFTLNCDHVLHTLSRLALSVFELLLFFDQDDFHQELLENFVVTFQECHLALARYQNVHLLQVERLVQAGGPWASSVLQAILSESNLLQNEVDGFISSELPVFFELRVRYLLSCKQVSEAMALAKCCARHPTAGQHLFFLQVYLTWLCKTSQHDRLCKEVDVFSGKDAVHIICSLEYEEKDDLLLALSRAFLLQQLQRGDMHYLCDLVFIWSKLHSRLNTSKDTLLEESHQLMLSATNVNSIFPFIRAILQELGEDGIQFCVELCANALESCLPCDVVTKSLIYKTIAGLLPNDQEVCRACALLVFFLERTVEAYKMVYLLYMHPDQEYHVEDSPIRNHVRFETLQILKKDLYFDPEFWNLIALRTNCLKLMSEKVVSAALEEIMEDNWINSYFTKELGFRSSTSVCKKGESAKKRHHKDDNDTASKRLKVGSGKTRLSVDGKKRGTHGTRPLKETSTEPLRRSFWQLDRIQDNVGYGQLRRTTRFSEKNPPKRRIRRPKWLLEDSGTLEENNSPLKMKKHGLKHQKHEHQSPVMKKCEAGQFKNNAKHKPSVNSHLKAREQDKQREISLDSLNQNTPPQVILELSLPDNELMGTFTEDTCNRQRGFPQVLLYKPTVKVPVSSQPVKTVHRKEVVLRARDAAMFVQQLHCYVRRQKGKGNGSHVHGSVSTITRSSVHGSPPKDPPGELTEKPQIKGRTASQISTVTEVTESPVIEKVSRKTSASRDLSEKSLSPETLKVAKSSGLDKVSHPQSKGKGLQSINSSRELHEQTSHTKVTPEVTEVPRFDKVLQGPTVALPRELCEEPAVEMKVTIASQTPTAAKVPQGDVRLEKASKALPVEDLSKTTASVEVSTADNNQKLVGDEISPLSNTINSLNTVAADPMPSHSQVALVYAEQELKSLSTQAETGNIPVTPEKAGTADSSAHLLKCSKGHTPEKDTTSRGSIATLSKASDTQVTHSPTEQESLNDISALTLVTEMVTELPTEALAHDCENDKLRTPDGGASKESTAGSKPKVPQKMRTTSSCSTPEREASMATCVQLKSERDGAQGLLPETPENSEEMETAPESEESKLEYCCTFCNKVFKGSRVVAHAMFHYRKDECMFCGTMFKDDLLAMMHLSDHIEKLKKIKESETKDVSTPKTSAKGKTTNMSSGRRTRGGSKKSAVCFKSESTPASRKLRSNDKPVDDQFLQEKEQNASKRLIRKTHVHKINGHIGRKKELYTDKKDLKATRTSTAQEISHERLSSGSENPEVMENPHIEFVCSAEDKMKETESLQALNAAEKQHGKNVEEKNVESQEKVCCPVDGCAWFTDLSKNRVALLYHALEDHSGEVKPLELAFRVGNSKCAVCMRVLWSFEHFQHHVERHRITPRHPCLHQGCTARFKTGMEMRRHTRRHSPLQAMCCLPGCPKLFICLWALNLHEREHYGSKSTKPDKIAKIRAGDKHGTAVGKKQQDHKPKDATAVNKTVAARKLRLRKTTHNSSSRKHLRRSPLSNVKTSLLKMKNQTKVSNIFKNLSNKDGSTERSIPNLRVRHSLRKVTNTALAAPKSHRVISSSLLRHTSKVKQKFKKQVKVNPKGLKRRGRPPKSKKTVHDENISAGQNTESSKDKPGLQLDQKSSPQLTSPPKAADTSNVSSRSTEEDGDEIKATKTSADESETKKSEEKNQVDAKDVPHPTVEEMDGLNQSGTSTAVETSQEVHQAKKCSSPQEHGSKTDSDVSKSKKHKVENSKVSTKIVRKKQPIMDPESDSKQSAEAGSVVPQVEAKAAAIVFESSAEEDGKTENTDSTQTSTGNTVPAVQHNSSTGATTDQNTQKITTEKKKSHVRKKETHQENTTKTFSSNSGKTIKKQKDGDKKIVKEKRLSNDLSKTTGVKKTAKPKAIVHQPDDTKTAAALAKRTSDEEGKEAEVSDVTLNSSGLPTPGKTPATERKTQTFKKDKRSKSSNDQKKPDPNKVNKKRKDSRQEGDMKIVKKKCKDQGESVKSKTEVQPPSQAKTEAEEGKPVAETSQSTVSSSANSVMTNGQASKEDVKSTVCKEALASYSKKPYMRLPPTAYLDEKYITMPKRRKEISLFQLYQRSPPAGQASATATLQRQRCANCFATFHSAEDLQSHIQLQKCSNLFGFDSDDEGNS